MDEKLYLIDLDCYARAEEKQKKNVKESHCYDFGLLPTKGLQKEFRSFLENRSRQCALTTMIQERVIYQRFCRMVKDKHIRARDFAFNNRILRFAGYTPGKTEDSFFQKSYCFFCIIHQKGHPLLYNYVTNKNIRKKVSLMKN